MAALLASSVGRRIAVGRNAGHGVVRMGDQIDPDSMDAFEGPRCAMVSGFSVHANICVEARDRLRLERLMRYAARPAVATQRVTVLPDGRLHYRLKRPWRDGTTAVVFERQDFIAKLAALVPAPRAHLTRYQGTPQPSPCDEQRSHFGSRDTPPDDPEHLHVTVSVARLPAGQIGCAIARRIHTVTERASGAIPAHAQSDCVGISFERIAFDLLGLRRLSGGGNGKEDAKYNDQSQGNHLRPFALRHGSSVVELLWVRKTARL